MDTTNYNFMFYGFAAAWLVVIGYLVILGLRERKIQKQLDQVKALLASDGAQPKSRVSN